MRKLHKKWMRNIHWEHIHWNRYETSCNIFNGMKEKNLQYQGDGGNVENSSYRHIFGEHPPPYPPYTVVFVVSILPFASVFRF